MAEYNRILVILAAPVADLDRKEGTINLLCKAFAEKCLARGLTVDLLDLYKEDFDPILQLDDKDSKILEYQVKIRKADLIVIFHPIWWGSVPAILKGFLDKVLTPGFAYKYNRQQTQPLLTEKTAWVIAVSDLPAWQQSFVFGHSLQNFWQRAVLDLCGMKNRFFLFGGLRGANQKRLDSWQKQMLNLADNMNRKDSILDLF